VDFLFLNHFTEDGHSMNTSHTISNDLFQVLNNFSYEVQTRSSRMLRLARCHLCYESDNQWLRIKKHLIEIKSTKITRIDITSTTPQSYQFFSIASKSIKRVIVIKTVIIKRNRKLCNRVLSNIKKNMN
jgi:hypothetical protein